MMQVDYPLERLAHLADENIELRRVCANMVDVLYAIRSICGGDVATHFSVKFAKQLDKAIEEAEIL